MKYISIVIFLATACLPIHAQNSYEACMYGGADIGAKINAAELAAGTGPADIWVACTGTVSTVPTIHSNHRLFLAAPLTWSVGPILNSNSQIIGTGQQAIQTAKLNGPWISFTCPSGTTCLSNVRISNLWFTNNYPGAGQTATLLHCYGCDGVVMSHNHATGIGLLFTDTGATNCPPTDCYTLVNGSNISQHVTLNDNFVDGQGNQVDLAILAYTAHVTATNNSTYNAQYNLQWWGGNAATEGLVASSPRWASNINVSGGLAYNVRAGFWGGMGENVSISGVTVDTCQDVGLDAESSSNVVFSGFVVRNCKNGGLAAFFSSQQVEFGPGVVESDSAGDILLWAHNSSQDPTQAIGVKIHHVKFVCGDPASLCTLAADPIGNFVFDENELSNAVLTFVGSNNSGYHIDRNKWVFNDLPSRSFSAVTVPGQVWNFLSESSISGNDFQVRSGQTAAGGSYAINAAITDSNPHDVLLLMGNSTHGFTNDAKLTAAGTATSTFILAGNAWGANSVTTSPVRFLPSIMRLPNVRLIRVW